MGNEEKKLCAPKKTLSSLLSLGEEFVVAIKEDVKEYRAMGKDTTAIDKTLATLTKKINAHKRALKL